MNLAHGPESSLLPLMPCQGCPDRMATRGRLICEMCAAVFDLQLIEETE